MTELLPDSITRRSVLTLAAGAAGPGLGRFSAPGFANLVQAQGPSASPPGPVNRNFPQVPTWNTELRELAPDVCAYIQAGGPAATT
jgi:hypothetical protein